MIPTLRGRYPVAECVQVVRLNRRVLFQGGVGISRSLVNGVLLVGGLLILTWLLRQLSFLTLVMLICELIDKWRLK